MMYDYLGSMVAMMNCGTEKRNFNYEEFDKLALGLTEKGIDFIERPLLDGMQIICKDWDAVIHSGSYGHNQGLLEIMGSIVENDEDSVEGYLTAEDILSRLDN